MKAHTSNYCHVYPDNWNRIKVRGGLHIIFPVICPSLTSCWARPTCICFTWQKGRQRGIKKRTCCWKDAHLWVSRQQQSMCHTHTHTHILSLCYTLTDSFVVIAWGTIMDYSSRSSATVNFWNYRIHIRKLYCKALLCEHVKPVCSSSLFTAYSLNCQ